MPKLLPKCPIQTAVLGWFGFVVSAPGQAHAQAHAPAQQQARQSAQQQAPSQQVVAEIYRNSLRRGKITLSEKPEISRAAQAVLALLNRDEQPSQDQIATELGRNRIAEPTHRQILGRFSTADPDTWLAALRPVIASALADRNWRWFGVASQPEDAETSRLLILFVESSIDFVPPLPAAQVSDRAVPFSGVLLAPYKKPQAFVTNPAGQTVPWPLVGKGRSFSGSLACQTVGLYKLEIVAEAAHGPHVVANFRWPCGTTWPVAAQSDRTQNAKNTVAESEAELLRLLNRDRQAAGLAPLRVDARLGRVARQHSEQMARLRLLAHHLQTTPEQRVSAAHVGYAQLAENLALANTEEAAERSLLDSPGHRRNMLEPRFTQVGLGVAFATNAQGHKQLYVTQLFLEEKPPSASPQSATPQADSP